MTKENASLWIAGGIGAFLFGLAVQLYFGQFAPTFWLWAILPGLMIAAGFVLQRR